MLKSILLGLDGSSWSQSALELGLRWARGSNALLVGLGVIDEPTICQGEPVPLGASGFKKDRDERRLSEARQKVEQFLSQFTLRCADAKVASKVLKCSGVPWQQITLEAQRFDLVLLGQESHFHFETQEEADDTLQQVLKHSPRPVVMAPRVAPPEGPALIAYDSSLPAARVLHAFVGAGMSGLSAVHVVSIAADHVEAATRVDRAAEFLRFHDLAVQTHVITSSSSPADVLQSEARRLNAGLLVMGAYGQSTLREFFFGSVTRTLLRESTAPLFLYH